MASLAAAVRGVDAVVHCAAFFRGATPEQAHAVNDLGTQNLAGAARAASVRRFIFTSTGLVYGSNGGRLAREDDPCAPTAAYPVSKLAAERFLLAVEGLDVRILRLPFVYGDGDPHIEEAIPMMRDFSPAQRMSIGHHADVAQAVARLLDASAPSYRIYNVVDDEAPELATLFASVGAPPPDGSNAEKGRAFDALLDGRRIREDLGLSPGSRVSRTRWRRRGQPSALGEFGGTAATDARLDSHRRFARAHAVAPRRLGQGLRSRRSGRRRPGATPCARPSPAGATTSPSRARATAASSRLKRACTDLALAPITPPFTTEASRRRTSRPWRS